VYKHEGSFVPDGEEKAKEVQSCCFAEVREKDIMWFKQRIDG